MAHHSRRANDSDNLECQHQLETSRVATKTYFALRLQYPSDRKGAALNQAQNKLIWLRMYGTKQSFYPMEMKRCRQARTGSNTE